VLGGDLNISYTHYPDDGHRGDPPLSGQSPRSRAENLTRDLMIISQKRSILNHKFVRAVNRNSEQSHYSPTQYGARLPVPWPISCCTPPTQKATQHPSPPSPNLALCNSHRWPQIRARCLLSRGFCVATIDCLGFVADCPVSKNRV
jgi:hypothetical protein